MKFSTFLFLLALALLTWQCETTDNPQPQDPAETLDCGVANVCDLAKANNSFGFDLFQELHNAAPEENLFISPNSVATALTMTLNGAAGQTFSDMQQTLQLADWQMEDVNKAYQALLPVLPELDVNVDMAIANAIYHDQTYPVEQAFLETNNTYFYSPAGALDFRDPASVGVINNWVSDNTNGLIPDIIDQIPVEAVMYLLNAIYFKAPWRYQFDASLTENKPFFLENQSSVEVPMMTFGEEATVPYQFNDYYEAIDLPYADSVYSMTLFLPEEGVSMDELVNELSGTDWNMLTSAFFNKNMEVYLPRFSMEEKYSAVMKTALTNLGMGVAFKEGEADFSKMGPTDLYISAVIHKTFVEVSEAGTEAAAVTAVEISTESSASVPQQLIFNKPFLFVIRENQGNNILFMGKLMRP